MGKFKIRWFGWGAVAVACGGLLIAWALFPPYIFPSIMHLRSHLSFASHFGGRRAAILLKWSFKDLAREDRSSQCSAPVASRPMGPRWRLRLDDNRLILLSSNICQAAKRAIADGSKRTYAADVARAMREHRKVDVAPLCMGISRIEIARCQNSVNTDGFLVDNADKPSRWMGFRFDDVSGHQFRIVAAIAEAADISPRDDLDKVAPEILKTEFKYSNWSDTPERVISF